METLVSSDSVRGRKRRSRRAAPSAPRTPAGAPAPASPPRAGRSVPARRSRRSAPTRPARPARRAPRAGRTEDCVELVWGEAAGSVRIVRREEAPRLPRVVRPRRLRGAPRGRHRVRSRIGPASRTGARLFFARAAAQGRPKRRAETCRRARASSCSSSSPLASRS